MEFIEVNKIRRIRSDEDSPKPMARRMGTIIIREHVLTGQPELCQAIFSKFVPVQSNQNFVGQSMQFWGYSPDFDYIEEGKLVPEYEVLFNQDLMGRVMVKFNRLTEDTGRGNRIVSFM